MLYIVVEGCYYRRVYFCKLWKYLVADPVPGVVAQQIGAVGAEWDLEFEGIFLYLLSGITQQRADNELLAAGG